MFCFSPFSHLFRQQLFYSRFESLSSSSTTLTDLHDGHQREEQVTQRKALPPNSKGNNTHIPTPKKLKDKAE
ncbi:Uncharacterized protein APZ42_018977 [Daphnia magna]|uniref:Uncharacterized protein n=1 Tax=Daphnia magna TaxID=35525 RepID=A0A164YZ13_9CRUS|nr:Uncharacterized protein APZ42_018977 [Daphnia magna]